MDTLSASALFSTHTPHRPLHTHMCVHTLRESLITILTTVTLTHRCTHTCVGGNGNVTQENRHIEIPPLTCGHLWTGKNTYTNLQICHHEPTVVSVCHWHEQSRTRGMVKQKVTDCVCVCVYMWERVLYLLGAICTWDASLKERGFTLWVGRLTLSANTNTHAWMHKHQQNTHTSSWMSSYMLPYPQIYTHILSCWQQAKS